MTKREFADWGIPPQADGEFVPYRVGVLERDEKAFDPIGPVVCVDEQPVQLVGETRVPTPVTPQHPRRVESWPPRKPRSPPGPPA